MTGPEARMEAIRKAARDRCRAENAMWPPEDQCPLDGDCDHCLAAGRTRVAADATPAVDADVAGLVERLQERADDWSRQVEGWVAQATEAGLQLAPESLAVLRKCLYREAAATLTALSDRLKAAEAAVKDPNAVHVNMLRGTIARPSWEQIKHVYKAECEAERAALERRVEEMRAETIRKCAEVAHTWLFDWSCELADTGDAYIEAQSSGVMNGRRLRPEWAKDFARDFRTQSEAVSKSADPVRDAILALLTPPPPPPGLHPDSHPTPPTGESTDG